MRALVIDSIMEPNDLGGYDFTLEAQQVLRKRGLFARNPITGAEFLCWDADDNGGIPDGPSWLMVEDRVEEYDAVKEALLELGDPEIREVEVECVDAGMAYPILRDALSSATDVMWIGYSKDNMLYVEVDE